MDPKKVGNFGSNTGSEPSNPNRKRVRETPTRHLAIDSENTPRNTRKGETLSLSQLNVLLRWLIETSITHTHTPSPYGEHARLVYRPALCFKLPGKGSSPPRQTLPKYTLLTANRYCTENFFLVYIFVFFCCCLFECTLSYVSLE
jgi:hypothetical protein